MLRYLYVIAGETAPSKIGIADNPKHRLKALQTGNPTKLIIHYTVPCDNVRALERIIHQKLSRHKIKGEWFDLSPEQAIIEVDWIMLHLSEDLDKYLGKNALSLAKI